MTNDSSIFSTRTIFDVHTLDNLQDYKEMALKNLKYVVIVIDVKPLIVYFKHYITIF